jgi:hypothetical protein
VMNEKSRVIEQIKIITKEINLMEEFKSPRPYINEYAYGYQVR